MWRRFVGSGAAFLISTAAIAQEALSAQEFVSATTSANDYAIQSSKLAIENAKSHEVKEFAAVIVEHHSRIVQELSMAIDQSDKGLQGTVAMNERHRAGLEKLLNGGNLAAKYVNAQVALHDEAVSLFSTYAYFGEDDSLKAFAGKVLPVLQEHRRWIAKIDAKM